MLECESTFHAFVVVDVFGIYVYSWLVYVSSDISWNFHSLNKQAAIVSVLEQRKS